MSCDCFSSRYRPVKWFTTFDSLRMRGQERWMVAHFLYFVECWACLHWFACFVPASPMPFSLPTCDASSCPQLQDGQASSQTLIAVALAPNCHAYTWCYFFRLLSVILAKRYDYQRSDQPLRRQPAGCLWWRAAPEDHLLILRSGLGQRLRSCQPPRLYWTSSAYQACGTSSLSYSFIEAIANAVWLPNLVASFFCWWLLLLNLTSIIKFITVSPLITLLICYNQKY